jgi:cyclase
MRAVATVPLIASGGAGAPEHFRDVFVEASVDGALAASVFHGGAINIRTLKTWLRTEGIEVRP